jgi:DNA polymerase I
VRLPYQHVIAADFEFESGGHDSFVAANRSGERPRPVCLAAKDLVTGQEWRQWRGEFGSTPPFPTGPDSLFVAYYASAEMGCFKALGWKAPANILDLFTEFRRHTNKTQPKGVPQPAASLVAALAYFGLEAPANKEEMRLLALRGEPWTHNEQVALLEYCATDIIALERLLPALEPHIDLPRALVRGRYMAAVAAIEWNGTPIDVPALQLLRSHWVDIQDELIRAIDEYGIFDGRTFKTDRWARLLVEKKIPWPVLDSGRLDLQKQTFRSMAKAHPLVAPYHELRHALSDLRLNDLAVGRDGRNRTLLSPFQSVTGRNQPSSTKYIFGPSTWLRGLIKPPPGYGVAYIDWEQQEFGIAAVLSGDPAKIAAYNTGDPYLAFGQQAGAIPADATKKTHGPQRNLFKQCVLATQYGQGVRGLAARIGQPEIVASDLLRTHRATYRTFWRWSDAVVDYAMVHSSLHTVFGWNIRVDENYNPRSLQNFPMQANGAEMLRLACCFGIERGIEICATVHDAVLICAPLDRLDADIANMRAAMAEASKLVLTGFELRTDVDIVRYPDRYMDEDRGRIMWDRTMTLISSRQERAA